MEKGKNEVKEVKKIKLNVNYVDFICKVMKEKLLNSDSEKLIEMYLREVKVKSSKNIERVGNRVLRKELRVLLERILKDRGVSFKDFEKNNIVIMEKVRDKKIGGNYIEI